MRFAIIDCCFAGQAIEAMTGETNAGIADVTHVQGVYTLTATTRNQTAHVPPANQQGNACTSFTAELVNLVTSGIPGGPRDLTFGTIYPQLRSRLAACGLPIPNQRNIDLADRFVFSRNIAALNESFGTLATETAEQEGSAMTSIPLTETAQQTTLAADALSNIATDETIYTEDRLKAAEKLVQLNPNLASEALWGIATDESNDLGDRFEAADKLIAVKETWAAEALWKIATDDSIDVDDRFYATEKLRDLNVVWADKALSGIEEDNARTIISPSPRRRGLWWRKTCRK